MGKIIVPKNHILSGTTNHTSTISSTSATLNAKIAPEFIYVEGYVIVHRTIKYIPTSGIIYTTSNVNYRVNLFDSISTDNKEVRFIKLTLNNFPGYSAGTNAVLLSGSINIYKYPNSTSPDCAINLASNTVLGINGTYWLTFDTSTQKYDVTKVSGIASPSTEPPLISKAIVPNKDNWMDFDSATNYSPMIGKSMSIDTGYFCNQPYIGRMINIEKYSSSNITISQNTTYNLTINTEDKILGIKNLNLGNFIGMSSSSGAAPRNTKLTFNIFINSNSTAVYSKDITITGYASGSIPILHVISAYNLYIDVKNNKIITEDKLSKAIDIF